MSPLPAAAAQDRSKSPVPERLWRAYPLDPTVTPGAEPVATSPPTRAAEAGRRTPVAVSSPDNGGGAPVLVLVVLALLAVGWVMTFLGLRRRRKPARAAAAELPAPGLVGTAPVLRPLRRGRSGRFTRATRRLVGTVPAIAMGPSPQDPGPGEPGAGGEVPTPVAAAKPAHRDPSQLTPAAVAPASPPDRTRAWTAEIEWRQGDAEGVFRVVARPTQGHGEATIAESARLEWPPKGRASVEGLRQAAEQLETSLLAAGWEPLPLGDRWYAKRFAWEARQPAEAPASAEPLAPAGPGEPPEARQPQRSGRFERSPEWPANSLDRVVTWTRAQPLRGLTDTGTIIARGAAMAKRQRRRDLARLRLTLYRDGRPVLRAPVGVGRESRPTPRGEFYIRNKLTRYRSAAYGPVAFGTSARSSTATGWPAGGFVGIHGTDRPDLVPGRVSHGCIRMRNRDVVELAKRLPVGTPLTIH